VHRLAGDRVRLSDEGAYARLIGEVFGMDLHSQSAAVACWMMWRINKINSLCRRECSEGQENPR
jgi:hypothetical protein